MYPLFKYCSMQVNHPCVLKTYPLTDKCLRGMDWNIHRKKAWCIRRAREVVFLVGEKTLEA